MPANAAVGEQLIACDLRIRLKKRLYPLLVVLFQFIDKRGQIPDEP